MVIGGHVILAGRARKLLRCPVRSLSALGISSQVGRFTVNITGVKAINTPIYSINSSAALCDLNVRRCNLTSVRGGVKSVALTTGFSPTTRDAIIGALGWSDLIDLALSPADVGRGRPFPDLNLTALLRLGGSDVAALATVGDTAFDVLAGLAAGAGVVAGVLSGAHDRATLAAAGAPNILETIVEMPSVLHLD